MSNHFSNDTLNFGIELELIVKVPSQMIKFKKLNINQKILFFSRIIKHNLKHIPIDVCLDSQITNYKIWNLIKDNSLKSDKNNYFELELVSPIITNKYIQLDQLKEILNFLKKYDVSVNSSCGFHLHISQKRIPFSLNQLKRICKMFITFEKPLDSENKERINNKFCQSNRDNINFKNKSLDKCYNLIDNCRDKYQLLDLINPVDKKSQIFLERGKGDDYGNWFRCQRYYKLNLTNLLNDKKTIEIRSHAGTTNIKTIVKWINTWEQLIDTSSLL